MYTETLDKKDKIAETILRNDHDFMLDERG
jgi:hypothetical protein